MQAAQGRGRPWATREDRRRKQDTWRAACSGRWQPSRRCGWLQRHPGGRDRTAHVKPCGIQPTAAASMHPTPTTCSGDAFIHSVPRDPPRVARGGRWKCARDAPGGDRVRVADGQQPATGRSRRLRRGAGREGPIEHGGEGCSAAAVAGECGQILPGCTARSARVPIEPGGVHVERATTEGAQRRPGAPVAPVAQLFCGRLARTPSGGRRRGGRTRRRPLVRGRHAVDAARRAATDGSGGQTVQCRRALSSGRTRGGNEGAMSGRPAGAGGVGGSSARTPARAGCAGS